MIDNQQVGRNIAALRNQRNLSQQALSELCAVTHQAVSKWEKGLALPDMQTMLYLCRYFSVSMEDMLTTALPVPSDHTDVEKEQAADLEADERAATWDEAASKADQQAATWDEAASKADQPEEPAQHSQQPPFSPDWHHITALAPFADRETLHQLVMRELEKGHQADWGHIMGLAPFLPAETLQQMVRQEVEKGNPASWDHIMSFAPFLGRDMLESHPEPISIHHLAGIVPFVSQDFLAAALRRIPDSEEKQKAMLNMLPFLPKETMNELLSSLHMTPPGPGVSPAPASTPPSAAHQAPAPKKERTLMRIARRAVVDDQESWLYDHYDELTAEELDQLIDPLADHGKWNVLQEMAEVMDEAPFLHLAQKAISHQQWEFLSEIAEYAEGPALEAIIQGAIRHQQWDSLEEMAEYADDYLDLIATAAIKAEKWDFLESILDFLPQETLHRILDDAMAHSQWDLIDEITEYLT